MPQAAKQHSSAAFCFVDTAKTKMLYFVQMIDILRRRQPDMSKKQFQIICILLFIIIAILIYIANQNHQLMKDFLNVSNYLSDKIDSLTTKVNMLNP